MQSRFTSFAPPLVFAALVAGFTSASCAQGSSIDAAGSTGRSSSGHSTGSTGAGGAANQCPQCVTSKDCGSSSECGQFGGDAFCAPDCSSGQACSTGRACTAVATVEGTPAMLCVPMLNPCGGGSGPAGSTTGPGGPGTTGSGPGSTGSGNPQICGVLYGPQQKAACTSCVQYNKPCQANGCYGGYWCNTSNNKCQPSPGGNCGNGSGAGGGSGSTSATTSSTGSGGSGPAGAIGPNGGNLDTLSFAIVGDTRPPGINDTAGYPSAVAAQIWQDVQNQSPRPPFAITTGDYMFATPASGEAGPQLDLYLAARSAFTNITFPAMGNHECTGGTSSNCGPNGANGITDNLTQFTNKLLAPINQTNPYYVINVNSTNGSWTSKFVFIAANAWDSTQDSWLTGVMAQPTTYTFVIRHERTTVTQAPGVKPSNATVNASPFTLFIVGHTHTYERQVQHKEVVIGNGGAPLTGGVNYGYVIATQRADGAMQFTEYDYATNGANDQWAVFPDGSNAP